MTYTVHDRARDRTTIHLIRYFGRMVLYLSHPFLIVRIRIRQDVVAIRRCGQYLFVLYRMLFRYD